MMMMIWRNFDVSDEMNNDNDDDDGMLISGRAYNWHSRRLAA